MFTYSNCLSFRISNHDEEDINGLETIYEMGIHQLQAEWHYFDNELKTKGLLDNINATWISVGTYPLGEDIQSIVEQPITSTYTGQIQEPPVTIEDKGIIYIQCMNFQFNQKTDALFALPKKLSV